MPARAAKKSGGKGVKPKRRPTGVKGMAAPTRTQARLVMAKGRLGRLRKKGLRRVRMTKMIRVCVASDSTNHPVWNKLAPAWKIQSIIPKVRKSKSELIGP